ncbi:hypothetical protein NKH18_01170 [Streptomyces sp. M10(2022)]
MTISAVHHSHPSGSLFAGADIASTAGLSWKNGAVRPRFEDEVWSFEGWADAPVQMKVTEKTWNFRRMIHDPRWQVVAKELALSWLATRDERVLDLPRARRIPGTHGPSGPVSICCRSGSTGCTSGASRRSPR